MINMALLLGQNSLCLLAFILLWQEILLVFSPNRFVLKIFKGTESRVCEKWQLIREESVLRSNF